MPQLRYQLGVSRTKRKQEPSGRCECCGNLWSRAPAEDHIEDELRKYRIAADGHGDCSTSEAHDAQDALDAGPARGTDTAIH